eukprot:1184549-Prorocentrum_minimum.AAC.2
MHPLCVCVCENKTKQNKQTNEERTVEAAERGRLPRQKEPGDLGHGIEPVQLASCQPIHAPFDRQARIHLETKE